MTHDDAVTCVCLTTYPKRAHLLVDALRAYALQTHPRRRLVVVNDGTSLRSTRGDVDVINVRPGITLGVRSNVGLAMATTPWTACWDDDDFALPEHLAALLASAGRRSAVRSRVAYLSGPDMRPVAVFRDTLNGTIVMRADVARAAGGYGDLDYAYDVALVTRMSAMGERIATCQEVTYVHRRHGVNVSASANNSARLDERYATAREARRRWPGARLDTVWQRLCDLRAMPCDRLVEPT